MGWQGFRGVAARAVAEQSGCTILSDVIAIYIATEVDRVDLGTIMLKLMGDLIDKCGVRNC